MGISPCMLYLKDSFEAYLLFEYHRVNQKLNNSLRLFLTTGTLLPYCHKTDRRASKIKLRYNDKDMDGFSLMREDPASHTLCLGLLIFIKATTEAEHLWRRDITIHHFSVHLCLLHCVSHRKCWINDCKEWMNDEQINC